MRIFLILLLDAFSFGVGGSCIYILITAWSTLSAGDIFLFFFTLIVSWGFPTLGNIAWYQDYKKWNKGICAQNGMPWRSRDVDSQGGRMYQAGDITCWISYPVDRGYKYDD